MSIVISCSIEELLEAIAIQRVKPCAKSNKRVDILWKDFRGCSFTPPVNNEIVSQMRQSIDRGQQEDLSVFLMKFDDTEDVNISWIKGELLFAAVWSREFEVTKFLLEHGVNPNAVDESFNQKTVLSYAVRKCLNGNYDSLRIVEILLDYGADPDLTSSLFEDKIVQISPRDIALKQGLTEVIELFDRISGSTVKPATRK